MQDTINNEVKESEVYSNAIEEIEQTYGEFLYSSQFFDHEEN
jgi:hypothetical protein